MYRNALPILLAVASVPAMAQSIISARAGLIHLAEGEVTWNGDPIIGEDDKFNSMKEGDTLATKEGRVEVLLNPGSFLRMVENSSFELQTATFSDTKLRLLGGSALIEVDQLDKESTLEIAVANRTIRLVKRGLYEFDAADAGAVRVYDGELQVAALDGQAVTVKEGREMAFNAMATRKFDTEKDTTALYRWGARRARTLAEVASRGSGASFNRSSGSLGSSWLWSPFCNCYYFYTAGMYSPYRMFFYTPVYFTPLTVGSSNGFSGSTSVGAARSAGVSSVSDSGGGAALPSSSASAPAAPNSSGRRR